VWLDMVAGKCMYICEWLCEVWECFRVHVVHTTPLHSLYESHSNYCDTIPPTLTTTVYRLHGPCKHRTTFPWGGQFGQQGSFAHISMLPLKKLDAMTSSH